jgi:hypothetical protein
MKIIAAGNLLMENSALTEIPTPLMKRFIKLNWPKNVTKAVNYLNNKYADAINIDTIMTNPRQTEMGIIAYLHGAPKTVVSLLTGETVAEQLFKITATKGTKLLANLAILKGQLRNGTIQLSDIQETYGPEIAEACKI